jgi:aspartate racemase
MKMIGMIGGMSWESTAVYYRLLNEGVAQQLGGLHSAQCLLYSFDFAEIEQDQQRGEWENATRRMVQAAQQLERGGADFIIICTNTMHRMADEVQEQITIPLLHIVDPTGEQIQKSGLHTIGLLGTRFTMEQDFYRGRLEQRYGLSVLVPSEPEREAIHRVIYEELCRGMVNELSRQAFRETIARLVEQGAEGIILGCTEIMMLIQQSDSAVPLFDTTTLHAQAAVNYALHVD